MELANPIKMTDLDKGVITGLAIPYGGPLQGKDLTGEFFSPETDFHFDWFPTGRPLLFEHGFDSSVKESVVGRQTTYTQEDTGVWATAQLNRAHQYYEAITELIGQKALAFSSGSMMHLIARKTQGEITNWPWVELSMTPTPANPWAAIDAGKSIQHFAELGLNVPLAIFPSDQHQNQFHDNHSTDHKSGPCPECGFTGKSLADHFVEVAASLEAFTHRVKTLAALRAEDGRLLSQENLDRIAALKAHLETLLVSPEPDGADADRERVLRVHTAFSRNLKVGVTE